MSDHEEADPRSNHQRTTHSSQNDNNGSDAIINRNNDIERTDVNSSSGDGNGHDNIKNNEERQQNEQGHSPEAAGAARGATRVAQKSLIGRLPKSAPASSAKQISKTKVRPNAAATSSRTVAAAKGVAQKGGKRLIRRQLRGSGGRVGSTGSSGVGSVARRRVVARTSDRVSKGADIIGSAVESDETPSKKRSVEHEGKTQSVKNGSSTTFMETLSVGENNMVKRIFSFGGALIKNTILGMAVFETYEHTIHVFAQQQQNHTSSLISASFAPNQDEMNIEKNLNKINTDGTIDDDFSRSLVSHHFLAGSLAGTAHSVIMSLFQILAFTTSPYSAKLSETSATRNIKALFFRSGGGFIPSTFHHAMAHSILFGSYEWIKRQLMYQWEQIESTEIHISNVLNDEEEPARTATLRLENQDTLFESIDRSVNNDIVKGRKNSEQERESEPMFDDSSDEYRINNDKEEDEEGGGNDSAAFVRYSQLASIAIAGGLAGSIQHIASHYTEPLLLKEKDNSSPTNMCEKGNANGSSKNIKSFPPKTMRASSSFYQQWRKLPSPPTLKSTFWAFLPSAIGFVAFEFGKDFV